MTWAARAATFQSGGADMTGFLIGLGVGLAGGPVLVYFVKLGYKKLKERFGTVE